MPPPRSTQLPVNVDPQPGTTIGGRYTIIKMIARGGVGIVYLARPIGSTDDVVVKVLASSMQGDGEALARFDREAERLSGVQHPNIVRMIDHGHEQGSPYLVMEYLKGELLADYLDNNCPLGLEDFAPIAAQVLKALNFAHKRGLMHRDIKPTNIMLCERKGRANFVKILDFGLAKLTEDERNITSEQIIGTANYLSPEQIRGEAIDVRVDVYALGVMFYAMLSGKLPFDADNNAALLYKHVHEEAPPLEDQLPEGHDIPGELIDLVHQCLAKNPADRPEDAGAMVGMLRACVPDELLQLPLLPGAVGTPSSVYEVLPGDPAREASDTFDRGDHSVTMRRRTLASRSGRVPILRPVSTALPSVPPPPPESSGSMWLVGAGLVLVGLVLIAAFVVKVGDQRPRDDTAAGAPDARKLAALLEQAEAELMAGKFEAALRDLTKAELQLDDLPALKSRAAQLRERITLASALANADELEKSGDATGALKAYEAILGRDPGSPEARVAYERLRPQDPPTDPVPVTRPGKPGSKKGGDVKSVDRTIDAPTDVRSKGGDLLDTRGAAKKVDDDPFLPTK